MLTFAKVDVNLNNHLKARKAGAAMSTWLWATLYCREHEKNGILPLEAFELDWVSPRVAKRHIDTLIEVGLFRDLGNGEVEILNYAKFNDTREVIQERRRLDRDRAKNGRNPGNENVVFLEDFEKCHAKIPSSTSSSTSSSISPDSLTVPAESGPAVSQTGAETELTQEQRRELNMNRYVEAYEKAVIDAKGGTFTFPIGHRARSDLATVMNGHCKDSSGKRYKGDKTIEWISVHVFNFVRDVIDAGKTQYYSGFGPIGLAKYLNESFVKQEARAVP